MKSSNKLRSKTFFLQFIFVAYFIFILFFCSYIESKNDSYGILIFLIFYGSIGIIIIASIFLFLRNKNKYNFIAPFVIAMAFLFRETVAKNIIRREAERSIMNAEKEFHEKSE